MPTLLDVANHANVSMMTVSRVLNNKPDVSKTTRERVQQAIAHLGYVPNAAAVSLKGGRTNVLGMVVSDLSSQYFTEIVRGASLGLSRTRFDMLLYSTSADPEHEAQRIGTLTSGLSDGLILVLPRTTDRFLRTLENSSIPVVLINHLGLKTSLPFVGADNYQGARQAVEHLLARGHKKIAFVAGDEQSGQSLERQRGYKEALLNAGIKLNPALVVQGDWSQRSGFEAATRLLAVKQPPSAIFAANDFMAFGVMDAIKEHGLRIPDDISVIGFDDVPMSSQVYPALTTVQHPLLSIGETAVRLILDLLEAREPVLRQITLPSQLILRASSS
jgi:LacI family transcriptional regulator